MLLLNYTRNQNKMCPLSSKFLGLHLDPVIGVIGLFSFLKISFIIFLMLNNLYIQPLTIIIIILVIYNDN